MLALQDDVAAARRYAGQVQRVQEAAAKEREALMAQVTQQLARIKELEASSTLQKLKVRPSAHALISAMAAHTHGC